MLNSTLTASLSVLGTAIATSLVTLATPAQAAILGCPAGTADNVTGAAACQYSTTATQDSVSPNKPLTVNQDGGFFGITNWAFGGKIGEVTGFNGTGSGQSGTWNLSSIFNPTWDNVMLVFKSGKDTTLVGYQLAQDVTSGSWSSPFESSLFSELANTKDVSHISVYFQEGSGSSSAVPEPTTMAGLAIAGAGLAASRRRKASAAK